MKAPLYLILVILIMTACGHKQQPKQAKGQDYEPLTTQENTPGDSALYGLACDGCTDSVLVFLPYSGGGLDTFDIITAHQQHRIYGRPHIGDELAVIPNPEDKDEALIVINMETLRGMWCYMVSPTMRTPENMPKRMQRRMLERIPDSIRKLMMTPREYSLKLKRDNSVQVRGGQYRQTTTDDMSPVEYPAVKRYTEWHLFNGRLVLKADTISGFSKEGDKPSVDTADIILLMDDSLVLRYPTGTQPYYKKMESELNDSYHKK